ncbi:MAG: class I SAM-dependent methyltransferase [Solimonas sp.]
MSEHFKRIYESQAVRYDLLVSREDYLGNLLPAIERLATLPGSTVVELGAGSGRLTRLLAPHVKHIHAYDASPHMLEIARAKLDALGIANVDLTTADNKCLSAPDGEADIAIAGWSFGHCCDWFPDTWKDEVAAALNELARVLRPNGTAIILETLGTGSDFPSPPTELLASYYTWLEEEKGFSSKPIRTDYRFASAQEARELFGFFFGKDFLAHIDISTAVIPECTGIWWRQY